jgi:ATP-dependent DNA helicase HFM1/MER3
MSDTTSECLKATLLLFNLQFQVPLTIHVIGQGSMGNNSKNHFHFWNGLDRNVPEIIIRFSDRRPSIVFCHSKADTEKLADLLAASDRIASRSDATAQLANRTRVSRLQRVLLYGIAYHHAGMEVDDRRVVEKAFLNGNIKVLCSTSTLAMGVNLPAHLVVIKGTKAWRGGDSGYQDLDQASLLQMIGRAGRPGFDTSGQAVIMTDNESKTKFEHLASSGLNPALSRCTGDRLIETMNTEISQRVITSTDTALNWIKKTLFFIQLMQDPASYGVHVVSRHSVDTHLLQICNDTIQRLHEIGTLILGEGQIIFPLPASHTM